MIALRLALKAAVALMVLVLLVLVVTAGRVWWFARQDDRRVSDTIVVLGAAQFDGRPSSVFTARLVHARDLWKDHVAPRIITVGGKRTGDRFTEASAGKIWLTQHGVPADRVVAVGSASKRRSGRLATRGKNHEPKPTKNQPTGGTGQSQCIGHLKSILTEVTTPPCVLRLN